MVAALGHRRVLLGALDDQHVPYVGARLSASSTAGFNADGAPLAEATVGGDHDLDAAVEDPGRQRIGGEAAEDHGVRCADPGAGQHGDDRFGDHRQVDGDPIAALTPSSISALAARLTSLVSWP